MENLKEGYLYSITNPDNNSSFLTGEGGLNTLVELLKEKGFTDEGIKEWYKKYVSCVLIKST